jgi:hypothetical protein
MRYYALRAAAFCIWVAVTGLTIGAPLVSIAADAQPTAAVGDAAVPAAPAVPVDAMVTAAPVAPVAPVPTVEAPAAPKEQAWWQAALLPILSALGLGIAAFIGAGLRKLTQLMEAKWKIDIPDRMVDMLIKEAKHLAAWAEEVAEDRLLNGDGVKTPGAEKFSGVVDGLETFAKARGWDKEWRRAQLEKLATSVVHLERSGDTGVGTTNGDRKKALDAAKSAAA